MTQEALLAKPADEWLTILETSGVPCAPVLKRHEMIRHPQIEASDIVVETEHPHAGRVRQARNAARFEGTPAEHRLGAPHLGEHTRELMRELGYSSAQVDRLRDQQAVAVYPD